MKLRFFLNTRIMPRTKTTKTVKTVKVKKASPKPVKKTKKVKTEKEPVAPPTIPSAEKQEVITQFQVKAGDTGVRKYKWRF